MKICAISDTHGRHEQLDLSKYPADVLIHAGDWTRGRDLALSETTEFFKWLSVQPFKHKICIAGNHEQQVEVNGIHPMHLYATYGITYLQDTSVTIEGINFFGSPRSNNFGNWAFMGTDSEIDKVWQTIPDNTNVLITHGPAYECNDKVNNAYGRDPHVGSKSLKYRKLELADLKLHISGHIHENGGNIVTIGNVTNVCASVLDETYNLTHVPVIISL
jgi:Icc-related predicted phosphoesterase